MIWSLLLSNVKQANSLSSFSLQLIMTKKYLFPFLFSFYFSLFPFFFQQQRIKVFFFFQFYCKANAIKENRKQPKRIFFLGIQLIIVPPKWTEAPTFYRCSFLFPISFNLIGFLCIGNLFIHFRHLVTNKSFKWWQLEIFYTFSTKVFKINFIQRQFHSWLIDFSTN